MTINKVAYVQAGSAEDLIKFLDCSNIDYNIHSDNCDEEELWIELDDENIIANQLKEEFLNTEEFDEIIKENVDYIIFY